MASLFTEVLDFALPKDGKHSDFKLKTEQKLIIKAVVDFFTPFARTVTFLKNFQQIFVRRTSSQSGVTSICPNLFQLSSKVLLYPELSEIIDRIVAMLEVRSAATANSFINPRYTISSVFRDLLIPLKLLTKISKSKKVFLPRIFVIGGARRKER